MVWGISLPPQPVILQPRPLQRNAGSILLVPLLPYRKAPTPLPTEIWTKIFVNVYYGDDNVDPTPNVRRRAERYRRDLLLICNALTVRLNDYLTSFRLFVDGLLNTFPPLAGPRRTSPFPCFTLACGYGRFGNWTSSQRGFMMPINSGIHFGGYLTRFQGDGSKTLTCPAWTVGV